MGSSGRAVPPLARVLPCGRRSGPWLQSGSVRTIWQRLVLDGVALAGERRERRSSWHDLPRVFVPFVDRADLLSPDCELLAVCSHRAGVASADAERGECLRIRRLQFAELRTCKCCDGPCLQSLRVRNSRLLRSSWPEVARTRGQRYLAAQHRLAIATLPALAKMYRDDPADAESPVAVFSQASGLGGQGGSPKWIPPPRRKPRKCLTCGAILDSGGASRIRTADLWIMIPSL
jgi:hypothetical protein